MLRNKAVSRQATPTDPSDQSRPPQTTASPAKGHQSEGCTQLRHQQSAPQASLKTLDGTGPGLLFLNEHFNATGAKSQQGHLCSSEEGRQNQQNSQQKKPHQQGGMGVARIELALGEL